MQILQGEHDNSLELTGALDIITAEEVRTSLLAHLEHHDRLSLDLSKIESCDTAGVQLLLAAQRSAEAACKPFTVVAATDAFTTACTALGISSAQFLAASIPRLGNACNEKENTVE